MKIFTIVISLFLSVTAFGQSAQPVEISIVKAGECHFVKNSGVGVAVVGTIKDVVFRVTNKSNNPVIIYGEMNDEDGFKVGRATLKFDKKKQKWLYSRTEETPPKVDHVIDIDKYEFVLNPNQSIGFKQGFWCFCSEEQYKVAVFLKSEKGEDAEIAFSNELTTKKESEGCSKLNQSNQ